MTQCTHKELTHVFDIGEFEIWAGDQFDVRKAPKHNGDIILSCNGASSITTASPVKLNPVAKKLFPDLEERTKKSIAHISIDWPDYSIPALSLDFWNNLVTNLPAKGRLLVHCQGGHGRTGTAISIIRGLLFKDNPVNFIRKHYCRKAVEAQSQLKYIWSIIGRQYKSKPAKSDYIGVVGDYYPPKRSKPKNPRVDNDEAWEEWYREHGFANAKRKRKGIDFMG